MKKIALLLILLSNLVCAECIGLLVMATGKYIQFVKPLLQSADQHFLKLHEVTYFVFTDQAIDFYDEIARSVVRIEQKKLGWPYDTMMRMQVYLQNKDRYASCDYLFAIDADMLFTKEINEEILSDLVGTLHLPFLNRRGTYETRPKSTAYVASSEGDYYFAGGFYGGKKDMCLAMCDTIMGNVQKDLDNNIIAVWHDESHLNRYFIDHVPTKILDPTYCHPETHPMHDEVKILVLNKDHHACRM